MEKKGKTTETVKGSVLVRDWEVGCTGEGGMTRWSPGGTTVCDTVMLDT